jgi:hypothetical protein
VSDQTYFSRSRPLLFALAPRSIGREAPGPLVSSSPISIGRKALPLASNERSDLDLAHCCLLLPRDQSSEEKHLGFWYLHPRYKSEEKRSFWYSIPEINRKEAVCGLRPTRPGHNAFGRRGQVTFFLRQWRGGEARLFYFPPASMVASGDETRFIFSLSQ